MNIIMDPEGLISHAINANSKKKIPTNKFENLVPNIIHVKEQ